MKKILIGLLALVSASAFAKHDCDYTVEKAVVSLYQVTYGASSHVKTTFFFMHEEQNSALNSKDRVYVVKLKVNNNDTFYSVFVGAENCLITKVSLDQIH